MAETVVMIHGMWGTGSYFANFRAHFEARGFQVVVPTLRHHAVSPQAPPPPELGSTSLLDYAADLEALLRGMPAPPLLLGHSMGGLLAQILAARGLCKAAVLLTPAAPAGVIAIRPSVLRAFWSGLSRWGFWRKPYRQTFGEAAYAMLHLLPEAQQRAEYDQFVYESGRAAAEIGFWLFDPRHAARVDARAITCPLLVLSAREDRIVPAAVVRQTARRYAHVAEYRDLPGHAHWVVGEPGWEAVAGLCADWFLATLGAAEKTG